MKPNSSLAKVLTFLHIQNLPNKKLVRQVPLCRLSLEQPFVSSYFLPSK